MKSKCFAKAATMAAAAVAIGLVMISAGSSVVRADDGPNDPRIQIGLAIAPVPLNLVGKNIALVGWGSYLVNAVGDCNGCHTSGGPPNFNYVAGRNPYFGQPKKVDPTVYLSGGSSFGQVGTPTGPSMYAGPSIIARNLTPDKTGLPEGGHTLGQFKAIMRLGIDYDHLHPTCTAAQLTQIEMNIMPFPVCIPTSPGNTADGSLLQVMPWPTFANMTDGDLDAIYAYLSAIPCIEGPTDPTNPLHNDCGTN